MAKHKFPALIHITREQDTPKDEPFFMTHENGVFNIDEPGKQIAVYQLVEVGTVSIVKNFVRSGQPANTQKYKSPVGEK